MRPELQREVLPTPARHWYGWQALSIDGGAAVLGLSALAVATSDSQSQESFGPTLLFVGAVAYGAGGPAFHLVHNRPLQALGSLSLRAALPVLGGAIGLSAATCPPTNQDFGNCGAREAIIGAGVGAVLAMLLDDSLLAWERGKADAPQQAHLGLAPVFSSDGRRELRIVGTF